MKLSIKTILPILLISAMSILLVGCYITPPEEEPEYTPGNITGIIAAPCCSTSSTVVSDDITPPDWCLQCEKEWFLQKQIEVILTNGEEEIDSTTTNEKGEYTFTNFPSGKNYIIVAICPDDGGYPLVLDVIEEVIEGKDYDAGITDCESTALGLAVQALVELGLSSEYIILEDIQNSENFEPFVNVVCEVLENCGDITSDSNVLDQGALLLMEIIGENPGWTAGSEEAICVFTCPKPLKLSVGISPANPCTDECATISKVAIVYEGNDISFLNLTDGRLKWIYDDVNIGFNRTTGKVCLLGDPGTYTIGVTYEDVCGEKTGSVSVTFQECEECPPPPSSLEITVENANPCEEECATIASVTVKDDGGTILHTFMPPYSDAAPALSWSADPGITFDPVTGKICGGAVGTTYKVTFTYTDECDEFAAGDAEVTFKKCCPPPPSSVEVAVQNANPCSDKCTTITSVTVKDASGVILYATPPYTDAAPTLSWVVDSGISFDPATGKVCLNGGEVGKAYKVTFTYTDECDKFAAGDAEVTFKTCEECPPPPSSVEVAVQNANPCSDECTTITSVTVKDAGGVILSATPPYTGYTGIPGLSWSYDPTKISFDPATGKVCLNGGVVGEAYKVTFTYTDECDEFAAGDAEVTFKECKYLPNAISHVVLLLEDGTTVKIDNYEGGINDPADPWKFDGCYFLDNSDTVTLNIVDYIIKAGTKHYDPYGKDITGDLPEWYTDKHGYPTSPGGALSGDYTINYGEIVCNS